MSIWFSSVDIKDLSKLRAGTMSELIGIEFTEIGDDYLVAKMPVDERTFQPMRIMHGGASCVLAETVASVAANCCVNPEKKACVGIEINTSHIKMARQGFVTGTARALHIGKTTQLWEIEIVDDNHQLISVSRLRVAVIDKS
jgi:1,4-dihydroxy-2-naphthoyl-CoA hydrolase